MAGCDAPSEKCGVSRASLVKGVGGGVPRVGRAAKMLPALRGVNLGQAMPIEMRTKRRVLRTGLWRKSGGMGSLCTEGVHEGSRATRPEEGRGPTKNHRAARVRPARERC